MRLCSEVVDLVGTDGVEPPTERGGVGEIGVVKLHAIASIVRIYIDVVNPLRVEIGRSTDQAMDLVAFLEEEFGQIRTVLAGDSGDQSHFARWFCGGGGSESVIVVSCHWNGM
jgi:hypothetical protein